MGTFMKTENRNVSKILVKTLNRIWAQQKFSVNEDLNRRK